LGNQSQKPAKEGCDTMPIVRIEAFEGRTLDQKRELAKAVTEAVSGIFKTPVEAVTVVFQDMKKEDYAIGGVLYCDKS